MRPNIPVLRITTLFSLTLTYACSSHDKPSEEALAAAAQLTEVQSCEQLHQHFVTTATDEARARIRAIREGSPLYASRGVLQGGAEEDAAAPTAAGSGGASGATANDGTNNTSDTSATPEHSDTNVQVQGVDEADIIKTDGNFIYLVTNGYFAIYKSFPASELNEVARIKLEGAPTELFVHGDRAVVFSSVWSGILSKALQDRAAVGTASASPAICPEFGCGYGRNVTRVSILDVSNRTAPKLLKQIDAEGDYLSSRRIDSVVRVVLNSYPKWPVELPWWVSLTVSCKDTSLTKEQKAQCEGYVTYPVEKLAEGGSSAGSTGAGGTTDAGCTIEECATSTPSKPDSIEVSCDAYSRQSLTSAQKSACDMKFKELESKVVATIAASKLSDWVPQVVTVDFSSGTPVESAPENLVPCTSYLVPKGVNGRGTLDVMTLDLASDGAATHTARVGHGAIVYASNDALYVASHPYWTPGWGDIIASEAEGRDARTHIHKFDIASDPKKARYVGTGTVPGHVLNQFSMDERNGHLRVATTIDSWWTTSRVTGSNNLFVLGPEANGLLLKTGSIEGLAPCERIYSVRFIYDETYGDRAYMVTFRQADPLFVFDVADPKAPKLLGGLKIPGFSNYIHPLGEGYVLTIGEAVDAPATFQSVTIDPSAATDDFSACGRTGTVGVTSDAPVASDSAGSGGSDGAALPAPQSGLQVSIFDVRDAAKPALLHKLVIGGYSEAQFNHKAFAYFADKHLLALPVTTWSYNTEGKFTGFVGLKVLNIDLQSGINEVASIEHSDPYATDDKAWCYFGAGNAQVRRALTIEDHLYSMSNVQLVANPLNDLSKTTKDVKLPWDKPDYACTWY